MYYNDNDEFYKLLQKIVEAVGAIICMIIFILGIIHILKMYI